jgi:hypothetical protein
MARNIPIVGKIARQVRSWTAAVRGRRAAFPGSASYWEGRYSAGGNSGPGSYSRLAEFKAEVLNAFVRDHSVRSVIEFGCGDGNQLGLAQYPMYLGLDVSETAVLTCRRRFASDPGKRFRLVAEYSGEKAEAALSLDVIYHLVEDEVFEAYLRSLFGAATRYVIIYSSDTDWNQPGQAKHVRHRHFSGWIDANIPCWKLVQQIPNRYPFDGDWRTTSFASFFIYEKSA